MVKGIVIPAVPFLPIEERDFSGRQDYQDAVGGYIEPVIVTACAHDLMLGDVVLLLESSEGDADLISQLLRVGSLRAEVQLAGSRATGSREFGSWFEAAMFADALEQRFGFVWATRVKSL